jgi:ABC-2 type transport system permease protein
MNNFFSALWVEALKAYRSKVILISAIFISVMSLVDGLFMVILKDPDRARQMGLIGAKATLVAGTATWPNYFYVLMMIGMAMGILYGFLTAWVFGREFSDRTAKELLALPTSRGTIVAAKLVLLAFWTQALALWLFGLSLLVLRAVDIPGEVAGLELTSFGYFMAISLLNFLLMPCVAYVASLGRGFLPPMAWIFFTLASAQLLHIMGWGEWYPWAVPAAIAELSGPKGGVFGVHSVLMVLATGVAGLVATFLWWRSADQAK